MGSEEKTYLKSFHPVRKLLAACWKDLLLSRSDKWLRGPASHRKPDAKASLIQSCWPWKRPQCCHLDHLRTWWEGSRPCLTSEEQIACYLWTNWILLIKKKIYSSEQTSVNFTRQYFINFNEILFVCVTFLKHLIKTFPLTQHHLLPKLTMLCNMSILNKEKFKRCIYRMYLKTSVPRETCARQCEMVQEKQTWSSFPWGSFTDEM